MRSLLVIFLLMVGRLSASTYYVAQTGGATLLTSVISGATTIYIRQTANSANTGNASFYLTIAVMN